jgi:hypothetical protein
MKEFNLYIDDSGTRHPDKRSAPAKMAGDWFALGGILVASDEEERARDLHAEFCGRWKIEYPLHSVEIRYRGKNFAWVGALDSAEQTRFFADLDQLMASLPVAAIACVIDRPGYNARYSEKYAGSKWSLCKTAFSILAERAVKIAIHSDARVRVYVEQSDKTSEGMIRSYYKDLRANGMPFANGGNSKYRPLTAADFQARLYDLKVKSKSSPMIQLADLFLYPICKAAYAPRYRPMELLRREGRLIEAVLPPEMVGNCGTKYSCFEQLHAGLLQTK